MIVAQVFLSVLSGLAFSAPTRAQERILLYGDSLSAAYGLSAEDGLAGQLSKALQKRGHKVELINASLSGETTAGGLTRLAWVLGGTTTPTMAILALGANDALRAYNPKQTKRNLDKMLAILKSKGIKKILLVGMVAPRNWGKAYGKAFNPIYRQLAQKHKVRLYPFILDGIAGNPNLNLPDGLHPNPLGIKIIVSKILPFVVKTLHEGKTK